jgi:hypothetical protein
MQRAAYGSSLSNLLAPDIPWIDKAYTAAETLSSYAYRAAP